MKTYRYNKRPGFGTFPMRMVYRILYPFFHCKVEYPEEILKSDEPVVFIANHYNVFGPISIILSMTLITSVWINRELMDPETATASMKPGLRGILPFLGERPLNWLATKLGQLACRILKRFGAIPVDRDDPSSLFTTMRRSVAALEKGDNLIIFPETGLPEYSLTSVTPFFSGFATLGKIYHRKTGKELRFCPVYIDEQHHVLRFGELVTYRADSDDISGETERVSDELNLRIRNMAAVSRGLEKEKGSPGRRTFFFFCNLIRFLLLIPLVIMFTLQNTRMILILYGASQVLRIVFNVVSHAYPSTNHGSFLVSHALGILTDIALLGYLTLHGSPVMWLMLGLIANGLTILVSNIRTWIRKRQYAGVNYFDTLSSNLICAICLQQLLDIRVTGIVVTVLILAAGVFLALSAGFSIAFNARIEMGMEQAEQN